ncbi:hypothetical protein [Thalassoglobus polymorphus]|nr:hypothetical protein [Thalassoglobus polymorphus]
MFNSFDNAEQRPGASFVNGLVFPDETRFESSLSAIKELAKEVESHRGISMVTYVNVALRHHAATLNVVFMQQGTVQSFQKLARIPKSKEL